MTTGPTLPTTCAEVRELAPDIALGLLTGEERAAALAHLERCGACRAEVVGLAGAADEVLLLAPGATPPPGFADRVVARIAELADARAAEPADAEPADGAPGSGVGHRLSFPALRRRAQPLLAAAAVLVVVAGVLGLLLARSGDDDPAGTAPVAVAEMQTGRGRTVGEVAVSGDGPATVQVEVPEWAALVERWGSGPSASYQVAIELRDGTRLLRPVPGAGEAGGWTFSVDAPAEDVAAVSVVDTAGRVWCSGRLPPV